MHKLFLGLLFATGLATAAGPVSIGIKAGAPLNDAYKAATQSNVNYLTNTKRYVIGPEFDVNLPFGLAVELDALYRRQSFELNGNVADQFVRQVWSANSWDFPLLLKIRMAPGPIKPYVSVGPTFRHLTGLEDIETFFNGQAEPGRPRTFNTGFTGALGLQVGLPIIRVSPEIRYTRWGWQEFQNPASAFRSSSNQWDFMLGITF